MKHASDDELILYFYGESRRAGAIDRHLGECAECAALYREIAGTLALASPPETPARDEHYGDEVWQRIRFDLPDQDQIGWFGWLQGNRLALAGACAAAAVVIVATVAGGYAWTTSRMFPGRHASAIANMNAADALRAGLASSERVRFAAIGDHLEESERVLLDVTNAGGSPIDVSAQQASAASLVDSNRFYRDAATAAGDAQVAAVLDDLERSLLDIVHGPSKLTPAELEQALVRLDAAALLFKVRVLSEELHEREVAPVKTRNTL